MLKHKHNFRKKIPPRIPPEAFPHSAGLKPTNQPVSSTTGKNLWAKFFTFTPTQLLHPQLNPTTQLSKSGNLLRPHLERNCQEVGLLAAAAGSDWEEKTATQHAHTQTHTGTHILKGEEGVETGLDCFFIAREVHGGKFAA